VPSDALIHPTALGRREAGVIVSANPERAGWRYITFEVRSLRAGERLSSETEDNEAALVILGGQCDMESTQAADDPTHVWVRETWAPRDQNSPLSKLIGGKG
jgi:5-keto 4-deoxyuronate isomerase family protein